MKNNSKKRFVVAIMWLDEIKRLTELRKLKGSSMTYRVYLSNYIKRLQRGYSEEYENGTVRDSTSKATFNSSTSNINSRMMWADLFINSITCRDKELVEVIKMLNDCSVSSEILESCNKRPVTYCKLLTTHENKILNYLLYNDDEQLQEIIKRT